MATKRYLQIVFGKSAAAGGEESLQKSHGLLGKHARGYVDAMVGAFVA